jgi:hypothetical protein
VCFFLPEADDTVRRVFIWSYGKLDLGRFDTSGGIDALDVRAGAWFTLTFPESYDVRCAAQVERTADQPEVWIGTEGAFVFRLGDPASRDFATNVDGIVAPIPTTIQTGRMGLGEAGAYGQPRFVELSGTADVESTWTLSISVYGGPSGEALGTASRTITIGPGEFEQTIPVPGTLPRAEWADITLSNARAGEHAVFDSPITMKVIPGSYRGAR